MFIQSATFILFFSFEKHRFLGRLDKNGQNIILCLGHFFSKKKNGFGTAGQKWSKMIKKSSFFGSCFLNKIIFLEKKKNLRSSEVPNLSPLPPAEKGFRQGFETENDITRPSREISDFWNHSFVLTFRCGAAYQP